jgi:hypothetical protein
VVLLVVWSLALKHLPVVEGRLLSFDEYQEAQQRFEGLTPQQRAQFCEAEYGDLYKGITRDLLRYKEKGISLEAMKAAVRTTWSQLGTSFVAGFRSGKPVLLQRPRYSGARAERAPAAAPQPALLHLHHPWLSHGHLLGKRGRGSTHSA